MTNYNFSNDSDFLFIEPNDKPQDAVFLKRNDINEIFFTGTEIIITLNGWKITREYPATYEDYRYLTFIIDPIARYSDKADK